MILVIEPHNASEHSNLIDEMFRLRARIFHDHLRWDVQVADGKERDKYDDEGPVYLIHADDEKPKVKGSLRLLPTTGPTVLADFFQIPYLQPRISVRHLSGSVLGFVWMTR